MALNQMLLLTYLLSYLRRPLLIVVGDCCQRCQSGVYWLDLMSYYNGGWSLILTALAEVTVFAWVYGMVYITTISYYVAGTDAKYCH